METDPPSGAAAPVRALWWDGDALSYLDQTLLPEEERVRTTRDYRVVASAIRRLEIRGAPAIGVAAAFGTALAAREAAAASTGRAAVAAAIDHLASTRPTAVNLFAALGRMRAILHAAQGEGVPVEALTQEAIAIHHDDVEACRRIGEHGARLLGMRTAVLTHCNAGALATAGIGTALGVITTAAEQGKIDRVYVDETRPLLQGARLTAWELVRAGLEVVLITDGTAATVLRNGGVGAVIVGADRIAANGDVANKVGTYPLAVLAARHGVPFYVAAPASTLDPATGEGGSIVIEERDAGEVTHWGGKRVAAPGVRVFAPAFDVTPNELVSALVTEFGVLRPPYAAALRNLVRTL